MRQISINIYKYDELSEKAKQKALEECGGIWPRWWEDIYDNFKDDNEHIGEIKVKGFDDHFWPDLTIDFSNESEVWFDIGSGDTFDSEKADKLHEDLACELQDRLKAEYEWITSEEYIIELININEYEFYENGTLIERKHYAN